MWIVKVLALGLLSWILFSAMGFGGILLLWAIAIVYNVFKGIAEIRQINRDRIAQAEAVAKDEPKEEVQEAKKSGRYNVKP